VSSLSGAVTFDPTFHTRLLHCSSPLCKRTVSCKPCHDVCH
jgi:hypothetical protein